jgi:hypothetical protein
MQNFYCQCDGKAPDPESHRLELNCRIQICIETSAQCALGPMRIRNTVFESVQVAKVGDSFEFLVFKYF